MVKYMLMIAADLDSITNLQPHGGCDDPSFQFLFKVKCGNCGEVSQKETCVILDETVSVPGSRSTAHLVQKCKFCGRDGTVLMVPGYGKPLTLETSEQGDYAPLMMLDCRGYEPEGFVFSGGEWKAESVAGTKYEGIDLSDGEFSEYDEKGECPVMISNLRSKFEVVK
ncbi:CXXC motif containing zinc binding protein [Euphorbia peplus]|nr:CXXC motif containing zinc binding protein [Euphorbia peplus]